MSGDISKLALGTVQFGLSYGIANQVGQVNSAQAKSMLSLALDGGIDVLDTAISYGDAEMYLGKLAPKGFKIITKLPAIPNGCQNVNAWVQSEVDASLSRLGVGSVYGLLLHKPEQLLGPDGAALFGALKKLKDNNKVQKIGISIYSPTELDALIPRYQFDIVQAPFNLIDRRLYSSGWMRRLKDSEIEIHTRSTFLQGLLLMSPNDIPCKFSTWSGLWSKWHQWLSENNVLALQASLAFPLSFSEIDRVVVGADSVNQLAQILNVAHSQKRNNFPEICSEDQNLINPINWGQL